MTAVASYTWSHSIDDSSVNSLISTLTLPTAATASANVPVALLRGDSDFDVRQNVALSMVYNIPAPHDRLARAVLGGWSFAPIYHYQTALPVEVLTGTTGSLGGTTYGQRPNLIPGVPVYVYGAECASQYGQGCPGGKALNIAPVTPAQAASAGCVAPTAANAKGPFCSPLPLGTQAISGNLGRNIVRAFPLQELDWSVQRDFHIKERIRLRFQADMFNVLNHPQFGAMSSTLNSPTYGVSQVMANSALGANINQGAGFNPIFSTGGPRNFQFALKLLF